ncbi:MAG: hypothetical protein WCI41_02890 [bacterium]
MEQNKDISNKDGVWWKPIMFFYVRATSWIAIPLIIAVLAGNYVSSTIGSQTLFFAIVMAGFGITCFGIYREIRKYKKDLEKENK